MKNLKMLNLLWLVALAAPVVAQETTPATNLLANGGFEKWQAVSAEEKAKPDSTVKDGQIADGFWFNSEAYERATDPKFPIKVTISKDEAVKHSGGGAVRIINGVATDIGSAVLQPITVTPATQYVLRGWMKAENIVLDEKSGTGVAIWTNVGPAQDFWGKMKNDLTVPEKKSGTFDWTPFEVKLDAPDGMTQFMFSLQLRRASGTLWFDDVELVPTGKLETIPTF